MWEILANPAVTAAAALVGRNVYGWAVNSMKDGSIQSYEWKQLGKTLLTLGGFAVFTWAGLNAANLDIAPDQAAVLVSFVDVLRSHFKK
jgi:hypothetical protein